MKKVIMGALIMFVSVFCLSYVFNLGFQRGRVSETAHKVGKKIFDNFDTTVGKVLGDPVYPSINSTSGLADVEFLLEKPRGTEYRRGYAVVLRSENLKKGQRVNIETLINLQDPKWPVVIVARK